MEGALNRMWALKREGRLLNVLDYLGALIREGRLKGAGRLFESLRYATYICKFRVKKNVEDRTKWSSTK